MKLSEIESKDIVNVTNGSKLGKISDIEINKENGKIEKIIVSPNVRFANLFNQNNYINISWEDIIKIGAEVIIVNLS